MKKKIAHNVAVNRSVHKIVSNMKFQPESAAVLFSFYHPSESGDTGKVPVEYRVDGSVMQILHF